MVYWLYVFVIRPSITFASLVWSPGCQTASAKKRLIKIQRLVCVGVRGAMRITPLDLAVQGQARSASHRLWSQMLVLSSPQSRAQQHIDAASEIGSPNFIRRSMLWGQQFTKVAPKIAFIKRFWRLITTTKGKGRHILYINFILRQIMKLTLHLFVHFRHFSLVCSICRAHYVHNYISLHSFQKENYL